MKLQCPQCGTNNKIEIPDSFATCQSCNSSLYIDIDTITPVYSFAPAFGTDQLGMYLKRDFEKIGFNEDIKISDAVPVYFPFWQVEKNRKLLRAGSQFPETDIEPPSGEQVFFDSHDALDKNIEVTSIDTQPPGDEKRTLFYVPFFQVTVEFNQKKYVFFINAVNGEVNGDPIPYISSEKTFALFPWFIGIFAVFMVLNIVFDNMLVVIPLCLIALYGTFQVVLQLLRKGEGKSQAPRGPAPGRGS